jgi:hypothetical protein
MQSITDLKELVAAQIFDADWSDGEQRPTEERCSQIAESIVRVLTQGAGRILPLERGNTARAADARRALEVYAATLGEDNADPQTVMTDLIVDMMHLADADGFSFPSDIAAIHFEEEKEADLV